MRLPVPQSWRWPQLKLALTIILCLLPPFALWAGSALMSACGLQARLSWTSPVLLVVALSWSCVVVTTLYGRPLHVSHLYARFFFEYLLDRPDLLSQLRPAGIDWFATHLQDYSMAFTLRQSAAVTQQLKYLEKFRPTAKATASTGAADDASEAARVSYDVMHYYLSDQVARAPYSFHEYQVNQFFGAQLELVSFLAKYHRVATAGEARGYVVRVGRVGAAFDQMIEQLQYRRARGLATPRWVLDRVHDAAHEFRTQLTTAPTTCALVTTFHEKLTALGPRLSAGERDALSVSLMHVLHTVVVPAYTRLLQAVDDWRAHLLATNTGVADGVWALPDGDAYYRLCLRQHTTSDLSPDAIHAMGLAEVARLQQQMRAVLKEHGVAQWHDFRAALRAMDADPAQQYDATTPDASRAQILADYTHIIADIEQRMDALFTRRCRPPTPCAVERVPEFKEKGAPGAFYFPAALDGSARGTFFANLRDVRETVRYKMRTLAYHEAVPGHHFQISIAQGLKHLPFFRRVLPFTAYVEGWALYTETLCAEHGLYDGAQWRSYAGYCDAMLLRAARLVVDTGLHAKRWTRAQAIAYMHDNTVLQPSEIVTEVERYCVLPGQACAYAVGWAQLMALRERARTALGPQRFDIRAFHEAVLLNGALPLTVLERVVDAYIAREQQQ